MAPLVRLQSERKKAVTRIALIDDHELVRYGLKSLLHHEADLRVVGEAQTMTDGMVMVERVSPHLVVLNGKLPDTSLTEACRRLLTAIPKIRILILSGYVESARVMEAIQHGAHGYVLKDMRLEDLTHAIRVVASGQGYLDPRVAQQALHWIRTSSQYDVNALGSIRFTPQERLIIPLLAEGKTNKEIAAQLHISDKTVKNYVANIFDKLHVKRRAEVAAWFMKQTGLSEKMTQLSTGIRSQLNIGEVQNMLLEQGKRS